MVVRCVLFVAFEIVDRGLMLNRMLFGVLFYVAWLLLFVMFWLLFGCLLVVV